MNKLWSKFHIQILWYKFIGEIRFLLTFSESLPGNQENPFLSPSWHVNNSLSVYLFLDSELNNGELKVQVKRAYKSLLCHQKKIRRKKISSAFNIRVQRYLYPYFKSNPLFSATPSFAKNASINQNGQDQQNGKRTWCRLAP